MEGLWVVSVFPVRWTIWLSDFKEVLQTARYIVNLRVVKQVKGERFSRVQI